MAILTGVREYLIVVLICVSMMTNNAEHLFLWLLAHLYVFFGKMSIHVFCAFLIVFLYWIVWAAYIFWILSLYWSYLLTSIFSHQIFSSILLVVFLFFFEVSCVMQKLLCLIRSHLFIFSFSFALGHRSKVFCCNLYQRVFCLWFLLWVLWFPALHLGV